MNYYEHYICIHMVFCLHVCLFPVWVLCHGGQKRASLGPELQITVSHYVGVGNRIWVRSTANADSALNHLARPIVHSEPTRIISSVQS